MGVTIDHVEGVVQKASEPAPASSGTASETPTQKGPQESFEETRRRSERMQRRLHAD